MGQTELFHRLNNGNWSNERKQELKGLHEKGYGTFRISYIMKVPEAVVVEQLKGLA